MLILILIDVQYSQKVVFSFEKGSNCQNHSSSGSLNLVKKSPPPPVKFPIPHPTPPFTTIWKTLACVAKNEFQYIAINKSHEFANYVNKDFETNKKHGIENLI